MKRLSAHFLRLGLGAVALAALWGASPAARPASAASLAPVTMYTDRAAFTAASANLTTLNFASANTSGGTLTGYSTAAGLTLGGVNFVGTENGGSEYALAVNTPAFYPLYAGFDGNPTVLLAGGNDARDAPVTTITLPPGITAVGTGLYTIALGNFRSNTVEPVDVTLYSGTTSLGTFTFQTFEKPTVAFAGFTSSIPITTIQVVGENDSFAALSSFVFGNAAGSAPVNSGPKITVTAFSSTAGSNGQRTVTVTTTNTGGTAADMLTLTSVTLGGVPPAPVPPSASPVPTTPNNLSNLPGMNTQTNGFVFSPSPGTKKLVLNIAISYVDQNNITHHLIAGVRVALP